MGQGPGSASRDTHENIFEAFTEPKGFPGGSEGKEFACSAGDLGWSPSQEDPLEKGMATHSSILAWRIPWRRSLAGTVHGVEKNWTQLSN